MFFTRSRSIKRPLLTLPFTPLHLYRWWSVKSGVSTAPFNCAGLYSFFLWCGRRPCLHPDPTCVPNLITCGRSAALPSHSEFAWATCSFNFTAAGAQAWPGQYQIYAGRPSSWSARFERVAHTLSECCSKWKKGALVSTWPLIREARNLKMNTSCTDAKIETAACTWKCYLPWDWATCMSRITRRICVPARLCLDLRHYPARYDTVLGLVSRPKPHTQRCLNGRGYK